ncbi:hypothetical protein GCM10010174_32160 [Kutzneria viridogrisea]
MSPMRVLRQLEDALEHGPFERALTLAVDASGLSLHQLQCSLADQGVQISTTTLSYWKNGRSRPERPDSLRGLAVLETVLELEPGALAGLLGPRRPRGRWLDPTVGQMWGGVSYLEPLLTWLDMPSRAPLRRLSLHEALHVGPDRINRRLQIREVLRASEQRVGRTVAMLRGIPGGSPPALTSTRYCRVGRVRSVAADAFLIAELVFDRQLAEGETTILEYEFEFADTVPDDRYDRRFMQRTSEHLQEVHFSPEALPASCQSYRMDSPTSAEDVLGEVRVDAAHPAHLAQVDVSPGIYGLSWTWA